ncbi:MAG: MOSC domain-containing protein [Gaiellaceae bacterium]
MATIAGIWTSPARNSGRMDGHDRVRAIADHGLEGCAHARPGGKRQVLFASSDHLDAVGVEPGRIRENFTVADTDVHAWPVGQRLRAGGAVFEVTMVCDPCERMDAIRPGLRAELEGRRGMLAKVVEQGEVAVGDAVELL